MTWQNSALANLNLPTPAQARGAVGEARRLFMRTLGSWASDVLRLNREGLSAGVCHAPFHGGLSQAA